MGPIGSKGSRAIGISFGFEVAGYGFGVGLTFCGRKRWNWED